MEIEGAHFWKFFNKYFIFTRSTFLLALKQLAFSQIFKKIVATGWLRIPYSTSRAIPMQKLSKMNIFWAKNTLHGPSFTQKQIMRFQLRKFWTRFWSSWQSVENCFEIFERQRWRNDFKAWCNTSSNILRENDDNKKKYWQQRTKNNAARKNLKKCECNQQKNPKQKRKKHDKIILIFSWLCVFFVVVVSWSLFLHLALCRLHSHSRWIFNAVCVFYMSLFFSLL